MKFDSSIWIWSSILLVCSYISHGKGEAYDETFKETLLNEFKSTILHDIKEALLDDFKEIIDSKMSTVNDRFDQLEIGLTEIINELALVKGSVHTIEGDVDAITGWSSESQLNIRDVKVMQENMTNQLVDLKERVDIVDENVNEMNKKGNDSLEKIINMGNDTLLVLKNFSDSLGENESVLQFLNNTTTGFMQQISDELATKINKSSEILNDSIEELLTKTIALEKDIKTIKRITDDTSKEMTEKLKTEMQIISKPISGINAQLAKIIAKTTSLGREINKVKEVTDDGSKAINKQMMALVTKTIILGEDINEVKDITDDSSKAIQKQLLTVASEQDSNAYKINQKLDIVEKFAVVCPAGYFQVDASEQCFKYLKSPKRSWSAAKSMCEAQGLVLAKPYNPMVLQNYIVMRYGAKTWSWVGARGVGTTVVWSRDALTLGPNNPTWHEGQPGGYTSSTYCLALKTTEYKIKNYPDACYSMATCTDKFATICELLRE